MSWRGRFHFVELGPYGPSLDALEVINATTNYETLPKIALSQALKDLGVWIVFNKGIKAPNIIEQGKCISADPMRKMFHYQEPLNVVLKRTHEKYGFVEMDCQLFAQVAALLISGKEGEPFWLIKGDYSPLEMSIEH